MLSGAFILSEKRSDRIKRHLLFWFGLAVYFALLQAASPFLKPASSYADNLPSALARSFLQLVPQAFTAYTILYLVVPLYIWKKQLLLAFVSLTLVWIASAYINIQMAKTVNPFILSHVLPVHLYRYMDTPPKTNFFADLLAVTKGVLTGAGFIVMLRYLKQWYMKEQRNLQLQKENTESKLQLLTARIHPQFLFHTLNNIYSKTETESPKSSKMIKELSAMLQYILTEGSKTLVPLQKELTMLQDYINLEKIRYGNKLALHLSVPGEILDPGQERASLQIAPLILLPFVENCFKHGASKFLSAPWINLKIELDRKVLTMKLMNGKDPDDRETSPKSGTGLVNVKRRLELLYPHQHELQITDEPNVFIIQLRLILTEGQPIPGVKKNSASTSANLVHGYTPGPG
jgi:sensor histidine kinase YesM